MKTKLIIAGVATLLSAISLRAQDTVRVKETEKVYVHDDTPSKPSRPPLRAGELGVRWMPTFTTLTFNTANGQTVQGNATLNNGFGIMLAGNFSKNIGIQGEVDYLGIQQKYADQSISRQVNINYLNIPVMLSLNTDKTRPVNLNVVVGPQFGVNVGSSLSTSSNGSTDNAHAVIAAKQGDVGEAYGAGLEFALNRNHTFRFDIGFRGMYGLVDISSDQVSENSYNVLVHASRKSYGGYAGLTLCW
jgi:hypothetical protein